MGRSRVWILLVLSMFPGLASASASASVAREVVLTRPAHGAQPETRVGMRCSRASRCEVFLQIEGATEQTGEIATRKSTELFASIDSVLSETGPAGSPLTSTKPDSSQAIWMNYRITNAGRKGEGSVRKPAFVPGVRISRSQSESALLDLEKRLLLEFKRR